MAVSPVVVVVAARLGSERFPGKVLAELPTTYGAASMLEHVLARAGEIGRPVRLTVPHGSRWPNRLPDGSSQWPGWLSSCQIVVGPENDLIKRHLIASEGYDYVVRVTGDCPFLDPWAARCTIDTHLEGGYDLTIDQAEGRGVQVYRRELLERMDRELAPHRPYNEMREHLDLWPLRHGIMVGDALRIHHMKFSIDTPAELELARVRVTL